MIPMHRRLLVFALVCAACIATVAGWAWHASARATSAAAAVDVAIAREVLDSLPDARARPFMLFRSTAPGESFGRVGMVFIDAPGSPRAMSRMDCERVHFAAGQGLCLAARRKAITTYTAHLFDRSLKPSHSVSLAGLPSRARVAADGRRAAYTVFVSGHAYANPGFSTRAGVLDTASGTALVDSLEALPVLREGLPFKAADFNVWGVTFGADPNRFHATLGTGGRSFLVEGDLALRSMQVVHDDVECPSRSPDGGRIAFKRRVASGEPGRFVWRIVVLELATGKETVLLGEARSVDDQVEWLDDRHLVYSLPRDGPQPTVATDLWALSIEGSERPRQLLPYASSPAIVRR